METALLMSFISYIYLQWPSFVFSVSFLGKIGLVLLGARFAFHMILISEFGKSEFWSADREHTYQEFSVKFEQRRANSRLLLKKLVIINAVLCSIWTLVPSQKTLGTVMAIGAATYVTHEVITSDVVQKFMKVVTLQTNEYLDEQIKALSESTSEPAK